MDARCNVKGGLKCWQYRKDATAVPTWACQYVYLQQNGRMDFQWPDGADLKGGLKDGDWLVEFDGVNEDNRAVGHYSSEEFEKLYEVLP